MSRHVTKTLACPHCEGAEENLRSLDEERIQCIACDRVFWVFVSMESDPSFIILTADPNKPDGITLGLEVSTSADEPELEEARRQVRDLQQRLELALAENEGLRGKIYEEVMNLLRRSRHFTEAAQESSSGCSRIVREKLNSELEAKETIIQLVAALQNGQQ